VALVLQTSGVIVSSEDAVLGWFEESIGADLFVTSGSPVTSGIQSLPMQEDVGARIETVPGVDVALPLRFQRIAFRDHAVFLIAFDSAGFHAANQKRASVGRQFYNRLAEAGTVIVSENFAALHGVAIGDRIEFQGPRGPIELRVVGTQVDYSWNRGTLFMDLDHYRRHFDDPLVDVFDVYVHPNADAEVVREAVLRACGAEHDLVVLTRPELRRNISSMIRRLYAIAYAQESVVAVVAVLGVVTALLISVLQRQRELGLLRAVGASQGQVLRSVLAEATLMGLIGALVGLLVGIPLEWYVVRVLLFDEGGFVLPLRVPWTATVLLILAAVVTATLAGLGPALRAVRLRIPEAIAYE
jgi:putative ABC transport system permease protein